MWHDDGDGEMGVQDSAWHFTYKLSKYDILIKLHKLSQCHNLCWMCI
jgi:hypothetical protein